MNVPSFPPVYGYDRYNAVNPYGYNGNNNYNGNRNGNTATTMHVRNNNGGDNFPFLRLISDQHHAHYTRNFNFGANGNNGANNNNDNNNGNNGVTPYGFTFGAV